MSVFGVFLVRIQTEYGEIQGRKTPNTDTFHVRGLTAPILKFFKAFDNQCNQSCNEAESSNTSKKL